MLKSKLGSPVVLGEEVMGSLLDDLGRDDVALSIHDLGLKHDAGDQATIGVHLEDGAPNGFRHVDALRERLPETLGLRLLFGWSRQHPSSSLGLRCPRTDSSKLDQ